MRSCVRTATTNAVSELTVVCAPLDPSLAVDDRTSVTDRRVDVYEPENGRTQRPARMTNPFSEVAEFFLPSNTASLRTRRRGVGRC